MWWIQIFWFVVLLGILIKAVYLEERDGKKLHCESISRRVNLRPSGSVWYSVCEGFDWVSNSIELRSVLDSVL